MASPVSSLLESSLFSNMNAASDPLESKPTSSNCDFCLESCSFPKVLICLHASCNQCLEGIRDPKEDTVTCPICHQKFPYPHPDLPPTLTHDLATLLDPSGKDNVHIPCTGCKSTDAHAESQCISCNSYICNACEQAHKYMICFEGHQVVRLKNGDINGSKEFSNEQNPLGLHEFDVGPPAIDIVSLLSKSNERLLELQRAEKLSEQLSTRLEMNYQKSKCDMDETLKFLITTAQEHKDETSKELDNFYNNAKLNLALYQNKIKSEKETLNGISNFACHNPKNQTLSQVLQTKQIIDAKLQSMGPLNTEINPQIVEIEFSSNFQAILSAVKNVFGYVRNEVESVPAPKPLPIARPSSVMNSDYSYTNGHIFDSLSKKFGSTNSLVPFSSSLSDITPYEKWSNGPGSDIFSHGMSDAFPAADTMSEISSKFMSTSIYPVKSNLKRQKMIYHCKFGEFGVLEGQFTEPSGVAVNAQNDIIVADTNNHRIQIFDKEGRFKFHFGECGKRDGQLLYPNRVAVVKTSGDIVVTERSPTHQIQIYNQYGQFVRKFGANILQHPRGVTVDNKGRIIVAECKVMRVIIFDQLGNVLQKFGCSKHLEFPNGVVVNDKQEIFISDNRAHCVKVFNYEGSFLRQIGGEGLTNYPIGVCINTMGEILVADNHNNFNITIFTQDGELINASESKVKHAQCFDVALMDDGSVVLASKDYRLYIYRYVQQPGLNISL